MADNRLLMLASKETGEIKTVTWKQVVRQKLNKSLEWHVIHEESCVDCIYRNNCEIRGDLITWCKAYYLKY